MSLSPKARSALRAAKRVKSKPAVPPRVPEPTVPEFPQPGELADGQQVIIVAEFTQHVAGLALECWTIRQPGSVNYGVALASNRVQILGWERAVHRDRNSPVLIGQNRFSALVERIGAVKLETLLREQLQ